MLGKTGEAYLVEKMCLILGAVVEVSTGHPGGRCVTGKQIVDGKGSSWVKSGLETQAD